MSAHKIRVFLVEDSPVALTILKRILTSAPDIEIVGIAHNGIEALQLIPQVQPHVICTDLHMPKMDGLELTQRVMAAYPCPILVISASVQVEDTHNVFQVLKAGAIDVFPKPRTGLASEYEQAKQDLINRVKILAGVSVFTQRRSHSLSLLSSSPPPRIPTSFSPHIRAPKVVTIGASTGGPQALHTLLSALPAHFPVPILCVQHISEGFLPSFISWLAAECSLKVTIAQPQTLPEPGTVYFAPDRGHLEVSAQGRLMLSDKPPVSGHCPSVTVLFNSVSAYYRQSAIGVLLTGMGRDGAEGLYSMAQAGGTTIAQDEATSIVFGMPKEAITLGAAQQILPIGEIAPLLLRRVSGVTS
ncbi:MAG TPA: chemotaxis-specific protein-glutamate methyltransferase CheB [Trichocoleus sp.]|jgi:two-component system chemotaxis response regulator CheB